MMVTWPRTRAFSVLSMALLNGGRRQAYSTNRMPANATAAKLMDDRMRTRRVRTGLVGSLGGLTPSGVSAMAVVVVVRVSSVIGWARRG